MRLSRSLAIALGLSLFGQACADTDTSEGVIINRGALGAPHFDPNGARYIVKFKNPAQGRAAVLAAGASIALDLSEHDAVAAYIPVAALEAIGRNPNIEYIEDDVIRRPFASGDSTEVAPYGIEMVHSSPRLAEASSTQVGVCVIDSGYHLAHPDLAGNVVQGHNDPGGTGNWFEDRSGHGTHVVGTIAAIGGNGLGVVGVNANADLPLFIVKVFDENGWAYSSTLVDALSRCRNHFGSRNIVVNMSLGGAWKSRTEENAFNQAYNSGRVLSIASAGNEGNNRHNYPASYSSVVSVSAIDANKVVASFSQYTNQVELAAPGVGVLSTTPWLADARVLFGDGGTFQATHVDNAAQNLPTQTGVLVSGGRCTSVGAWSGRVVLCERGDVDFATKVANVEAGGGVAAVIYDNEPGELYATLGDGNSSAIPAVALSQSNGQWALANLVGQSVGVVATFDPVGSGYEAWDGTSMAAPHVSGAAAFLWRHFPTRSNADIRAALTSTAEDLGAAGRDVYYGFGLVNLKAAYVALGGGGGGGGEVCTATEMVEASCNDGLDNDCDGQVDSADTDCQTMSCAPRGARCEANADCCSRNCSGKAGNKTCK